MSTAAAWPQKVGRFLWKELKLVLPSMLYFFVAFNLIAVTSSLLVQHYWFQLTNFLLATGMALVVGKVILVAAELPFLERYRDGPLIRPILLKAVFYWVVVGLVRLLEQIVHVTRDDRGFRVALDAARDAFSWQHFALIQAWLLACFLVYVTVSELAARLGEGGLIRMLFHQRPGSRQDKSA